MKQPVSRITQRNRIFAGLSIMMVVALIHIFRLGSYLNGNLYSLYYSYASDIMLPFAIYFLLCLEDLYITVLRKWYVKAVIIIGFTTLVEILQAFGVHILGTTFDPIDILMYAAGVGLAIIIDRLVFSRLIPCWDIA